MSTMKKNKQYTRDIDVFDDDKYLGTIKDATSYNDAIKRSRRELNLPLSQSGYIYRNSKTKS